MVGSRAGCQEWDERLVVSREDRIPQDRASSGWQSAEPIRPNALYHIRYDDGNKLDNLEDYWVCSKRDYELLRKCADMGWKPIGVAERFDEGLDNEWARMVGWYVVNVDDKEQSFSFLGDAMKVHDACVICGHSTWTKRSYLNLPELYPQLFEDAWGGVKGNSRGVQEGCARSCGRLHEYCRLSNFGV